MRFKATVYGKKVVADSYSSLKRKASLICNGRCNAFDEMEVTASSGQHFRLTRTNKKTPWGSITFGEWQ